MFDLTLLLHQLIEALSFCAFIGLLIWGIPMIVCCVWAWIDEYNWRKKQARIRREKIRAHYYDRES